MKPRHHEHPECRAISETLQLVGDKWTVLVVSQLGQRTMRFNELRHSIEYISQKMLTTTLRQLERDGFVTRTVFPVIPPRVDYALTDLGRDLLGPVQGLIQWARDNSERMERARQSYEVRVAAE
ncbi:MAG TPA: helix-turn-helix domain-containing protein [Mesorhizobium sp.]